MNNREELQSKLEEMLGSRNVYFQPPRNVGIQYPCFIYHRARPDVNFADDKAYRVVPHYTVTYIDSNPVNSMVDDMLTEFPMCTLERSYAADNLNHEVFDLFY